MLWTKRKWINSNTRLDTVQRIKPYKYYYKAAVYQYSSSVEMMGSSSSYMDTAALRIEGKCLSFKGKMEEITSL